MSKLQHMKTEFNFPGSNSKLTSIYAHHKPNGENIYTKLSGER